MRALVAAGLVLVLLSAACGSAEAPPGRPPRPQILMLAGPAASSLRAAGVARSPLLRHTRVMVTGDRFRPLYPVAWPGGSRVAAFQSFAAFRKRARRLPQDVKLVMYDPEPWRYTPLREQRNPARYMNRFGALAHARGLRVAMAPSPSLVSVPGAACPRRPGEAMSAAYLRCGLPEAAAAGADLVDLQLQVLERDPATYGRFVRRAERGCREANPDVEVLSQLSTSPSTYRADPHMLVGAARAVAGTVDGFYLSVEPSEVSVAEAFLRGSPS